MSKEKETKAIKKLQNETIMKKPKEFLKLAKESFDKSKKDNTVISRLYEIKEEYEKGIDYLDGDKISRLMSEASVLMVNLGQMVAKVQLLANSSYIYYKWMNIVAFKSLREYVNTIKDAEAEATLETKKEMEDRLLNQYKADYLKTMYDDMRRVYESMRSRLSYLKFEIQSSNETEQKRWS